MATVLVVDPDLEALRQTAEWLRRSHRVRVAAGFREALAAFRDGAIPDVVITEHVMPPYQGDDLLSILAVRFPDVGRIIYTSVPRHALDGAGALANHVVAKNDTLAALDVAIDSCARRS